MNLVDCIIAWENLSDRIKIQQFRLFWPIMTNYQKQLWYVKVHDTYIYGDVDEMIGAFSGS